MAERIRSKNIIEFAVLLLTLIFTIALTCNVYADSTPIPVSVIQTTKDGDRMAIKPDISWVPEDGSTLITLNIYAGTAQQGIEGFGGAFTESGAYVLGQLAEYYPEKRTEILNKLFNPATGLGYTLCRTVMNSCDFAMGSYSYDDYAGDTSLANFDISPDLDDLIPYINDAEDISGANFKTFASVWSPPYWMKDTGTMLGGGSLLPEYRQTWATYFLKYLQAYHANGIDIWGVSVQNEPNYEPEWEGMLVTPPEMAEFVRDYLGPTLENNDYGNVKIIVGDDQTQTLGDYATAAFSDPVTKRYTYAAATHWYQVYINREFLLNPNADDFYKYVDEISIKYPEKKYFTSEACEFKGPQIGEWDNAENYAHDIINMINNGACGWVDWNMVLNMDGGPYHVENPCSAPVHVDAVSGTYVLNTQYYALGHFSKYVKPNFKKIGSVMTANSNNLVQATAFKNTDGQIVLVVQNKKAGAAQIKVKDGAYIFKPILPANSITTFIYSRSNNAAYEAEKIVSLKSYDNMYVTNPADDEKALKANFSGIPGNAQKFFMYTKADGYITLKSILDNQYLSCNWLNNNLQSNREFASTAAGSYERFELITNDDGSVSLKAAKNGKYVTAQGTSDIVANSRSIGNYQKFTITAY